MAQVLGRYSKIRFRLPELQNLLAMTPDGCPVVPVHSVQHQHRLSTKEIATLVVEYQARASTTELIERYDVDRHTALKHLRVAGVPIRLQAKVDAEMRRAIVERYRQGVSLSLLAQQFGVSHTTVRNVLVAAGVSRRPARKPKSTRPDS
jgi:hypothetical protein